MLMVVVSIRDAKSKLFSQPMFFTTAAVAVRAFGDACKGESDYARHPEDYSLWLLGSFEDTTGRFELGLDLSPEILIQAVNLVVGL